MLTIRVRHYLTGELKDFCLSHGAIQAIREPTEASAPAVSDVARGTRADLALFRSAPGQLALAATISGSEICYHRQ